MPQGSQLYANQAENGDEARRLLRFGSALSCLRQAQPREEGSGGGNEVADERGQGFRVVDQRIGGPGGFGQGNGESQGQQWSGSLHSV